jgi:hypothetical protein
VRPPHSAADRSQIFRTPLRCSVESDLTDYLTPATIRHYDGCEHCARTEAHLAFPNEDPAEVLRRVQVSMLEEARDQFPFAHIPLPAATDESDTWEDDGTGTWSRVVFSTQTGL